MSSDKTSDKFYGVVIIGAGIAGLTVAETLTAAGFEDFLILEASNRIGGRCRTEDFGSSFVELGANWIHGTTSENSVMVLAEENDLAIKHQLMNRARGHFYRSNDRQIDKELGAKVWTLCKEIEAEVETGHPCPSKGDKTVFTMKDYYVKRLQENLIKFQGAERPDVIAIFNCFSNYLRFHWGGEIAHIPLELCSMTPETEGGDVLIPKGTRSLVNAILSRFRCEGRLNTEKQATSISWGDDLVEVRCSSGDIYRAKCVVITVSLGYLKEHHRDLFQPSLPHDKIKAIDGLDFGLVDKIFLHYDHPFWSSEVGFGSVKLAWDDDEAVITDPESQWYKRIFSFDDVYFNPSCLCVWISCNEAYHMEHLSEEDISETCTSLLRQFLGDPSIPKPSKVIWSTWGTNQHTLGSYSCLGMRSDASHFGCLAEPLTDSNGRLRVLFAGEATHTKYHSTMHGARESGVREATRLLRYFGGIKAPTKHLE